MDNSSIKIVGAGLAGCEAAWQLANRGISVKLYETGGSDKVGSQTRGAPSLTKGKADFKFHQQDLDSETTSRLETWFLDNYSELHDKYLGRYKL